MKKLANLPGIVGTLIIFGMLVTLLILSSGLPPQNTVMETGAKRTRIPTLSAVVAETVTSVPTEPRPLGHPTRTPAPDEFPITETLEPPGGSPEPYSPPATATPLPSIPNETRLGLWTENLIISEPETFSSEITNVTQIVPSPDGTALAVVYENGKTFRDDALERTYILTSIAVIDLASNSIMQRVEQGSLPSWSPDGKHIAYAFDDFAGGPNLLKILDVETGDTNTAAQVNQNDIWGDWDWLSEHELVVYINESLLYDLDTSSLTSLLDAETIALVDKGHPLGSISISPSRKRIALGSSTQIFVLQRKQNKFKLIRQFDKGADRFAKLELSPDGKFLAFLNTEGRQVEIVNLEVTDRSPVQFGGQSDQLNGWSPDSTSLFFTDRRDGRPQMINQDGSGYQAINSFRGKQAAWIATGQRVFWIDLKGQIMSSVVSKR